MDYHQLLASAWLRVKGNGGGPGIDGVTLEIFEEDLAYHLTELAGELVEGAYRPGPVRKITIGSAGKTRDIGILNVRDRLVHQAVAVYLTPLVEPKLLECCYSYRPGRSALTAINKLNEYIDRGCSWVMETDIANFFDHIDHQILLEALYTHFPQSEIISVIETILQSVSLKEMTLIINDKGTIQGSPMSPVLSNLYLLPLDALMTDAGFRYIRYSDDFVVVGQTREEVSEALSFAWKEAARVKLSLKEEKTTIKEVVQGFEFLGFHFNGVEMTPGRKALTTLLGKLDQVWVGGLPPHEVIPKVIDVLRGWSNYYNLDQLYEESLDFHHYISLLVYAWEKSHSVTIRNHVKGANNSLSPNLAAMAGSMVVEP